MIPLKIYRYMPRTRKYEKLEDEKKKIKYKQLLLITDIENATVHGEA